MSARAVPGPVRSRHRSLALAALALLLAACGGLTGRVRPAAPVAEIPRGEYQASAFVALAPTVPPDGEVVAAVVYVLSGAGLEVRDSPRGWLLERPLGRGTGTEHHAVVKSPANYATVAFTRRDGRPIAYAALHRRGVHGAVQDQDEDSLLFLSTLDFVDPNYIRSDDGRDGH